MTRTLLAGENDRADAGARAVDEKTIRDFGDQWHLFTENEGFYGEPEVLRDVCGDLLDVGAFGGKRVCEIGAGAGRFVRILSRLGASEILAVEPSASIEVLRRNTADCAAPVRFLHDRGENLAERDAFDFVVSIGVIHHIVDPLPTLEAAHRALKPGGKLVVWVYGHEGNEAYLAVVGPVRAVTKHIPDTVLMAIARVLLVLTRAYVWLCRRVRLPLRDYMLNVMDRFSEDKKLLAIFDQLNPAHAKYYRRDEIAELVARAGFADVRLHHRHGYSWSVLAEKPVASP